VAVGPSTALWYVPGRRTTTVAAGIPFASIAWGDPAGRPHVLTLAGAPHAPQRTHPEATTLALLHALG
jgi:hypothetical protein